MAQAGRAHAWTALYKENFDKFPPEIQDSITTAPDKRTPIQWQMYYKAKPQLEHTPEEAAKKLKGDAKKRWTELKAAARQVRQHQAARRARGASHDRQRQGRAPDARARGRRLRRL